jgi:predicted phosphatase
MYTKNSNGNIMLYDVDNTLIFFKPLPGVTPVTIITNGHVGYIYPNESVILSLKNARIRGHYVRVHSQGGADWAEAVIKALQLEEYVDSIECKPKWYWDDLDANSWMERIIP